MKNLLLTFTIALLLAACSTGPTSTDTKYQQHIIGNWLQTKPTFARYIGPQGQLGAANRAPAAGDTVQVLATNRYHLTLEADTVHFGTHTGFVVQFVDSSFTFSQDSIDIGNTDASFANNYTGYISFTGSGGGINSDRYYHKESGNVVCGEDHSYSVGDMYITTRNSKGEAILTYQIDVNGMVDIIYGFSC